MEKINNANFNEIHWHDSIIYNINIDRKNPGENDTIDFEIDWYDSGIGKLSFKDVYWAKLNLNFGIVSNENILSGFIVENNDPDKIDLYTKWKGLIDDIQLDCFIIKLNSTGGEIKIIAKSFEVIYPPSTLENLK